MVRVLPHRQALVGADAEDSGGLVIERVTYEVGKAVGVAFFATREAMRKAARWISRRS